ncbi:hypothetical protein XENOCAPTIV_011691 [Xenoophorus captivus]|uniref:Uncharacterized protein n=1 Tax=Xenoophorus captivus TaxID=1517983 RepID=A0ABV0RKH8_9TELE
MDGSYVSYSGHEDATWSGKAQRRSSLANELVQVLICVQLYTRIGQLTTGEVDLPIYRCAQGSTSLESFHMYLNRFIPGTSASDCHFQMCLLQALTWWNQERTQVAAGAGRTRGESYTELENKTLIQLGPQLL